MQQINAAQALEDPGIGSGFTFGPYPDGVLMELQVIDATADIVVDREDPQGQQRQSAVIPFAPGYYQFSQGNGISKCFNHTPGAQSYVLVRVWQTDDPIPQTPVGFGIASVNPITLQPTPVTVDVSGVSFTPNAFQVPNPGAGVSAIPLVTFGGLNANRVLSVSYEVRWDNSSGLGDRMILYEILDALGAHFAWIQPGNTIYKEASSPHEWLEYDAAETGWFRTIPTAPTTAEPPFDTNSYDFESSNPWGGVLWPFGFSLRLTVWHMAVTDEVLNIYVVTGST